MITFSDVSGPCLVDDGVSQREASAGMRMDVTGRPCIIATGDTGRAVIDINGKRIDMGHRSWIKVDALGTKGAHRHYPPSDLRILVGRLWARIDKDRGFDEDFNNAGGGVRG